MLKNYLTIAIRNLLRSKTYTLINIAGLAVGMAVCTICHFHITRMEYRYDYILS